jgi:hypothetical protein
MNDHMLTISNTHSSGTLGSALYATGSSPTAPTIYGYHAGDGHAIYGRTAGAYPAMEGRHSGSGIGIWAATESTDTQSGFGIVGFKSGYSTADLGGYYTSGFGVFGWAQAGSSQHAIHGRNSSSSGGWAGYFESTGGADGVYITTPSGKVGLNVINGSKNAVVRTDDGSRLLYAEESTEVWFADYGFGQLENGQTTIAIDPVFAQTVNLEEPYHVFVQIYGDAEVYVSERTAQGFEVHLREGDANVEFSYRIVAKRLGFEKTRLERAPWADNDPNLYPEKRGSAEAAGQGQGAAGGQP